MPTLLEMMRGGRAGGATTTVAVSVTPSPAPPAPSHAPRHIYAPPLPTTLPVPAAPCPTCSCPLFWMDGYGNLHCEECRPLLNKKMARRRLKVVNVKINEGEGGISQGYQPPAGQGAAREALASNEPESNQTSAFAPGRYATRWDDSEVAHQCFIAGDVYLGPQEANSLVDEHAKGQSKTGFTQPQDGRSLSLPPFDFVADNAKELAAARERWPDAEANGFGFAITTDFAARLDRGFAAFKTWNDVVYAEAKRKNSEREGGGESGEKNNSASQERKEIESGEENKFSIANDDGKNSSRKKSSAGSAATGRKSTTPKARKWRK